MNQLLSFVLIIAVASTVPLFDPSEARFALIVKLSKEHESYFQPMFYNNSNELVYYYSKPPLYVWFAMIFNSFMPIELAQRFPSLLAGFIYLFLLPILFGLNKTRILTFVTCYPAFIIAMILGITDTLFSFFLICSLICFFHLNKPILAGFFCGLSVLTKGPVGLVLIVPSILLAKFFGFPNKGLLSVIFTSILTSSWWFIYSSIRDKGFVDYYFVQENLNRFLGKGVLEYGTLHKEPYGLAAIGSLLFFVPYVKAFFETSKTLFAKKNNLSEAEKIRLAALIFILVVITFYSFSRTFLFSYLLPIAFALPIVLSDKDLQPTNTLLNFVSFVFIVTSSLYCAIFANNWLILLTPAIATVKYVFYRRDNVVFLFTTLAIYNIIAVSRSNYDLKKIPSIDCSIVKHIHSRYHSAEIYLPMQVIRTTPGNIASGDCVLLEKDEVDNTKFQEIFRGRNLVIAKAI
ncbi:MAG: hypothetical protein N2654_04740 [Deltaproteobacteria bacterium]|nr:hypothetical protein [Deltaproteobacteria bacterium]